jgi:hypothetical protein
MLKMTALLVLSGALLSTGALAGEKSSARKSNREYGVSVTFPGNSTICTSYSGEHPHGFYSINRPSKVSCADSTYKDKFLTAYAEYNTAYDKFGNGVFATCLDRGAIPNDVYAEFSKARNFVKPKDIVCVAKEAGTFSLYIYKRSRRLHCCAADSDTGPVPAIFYYVRLTPQSLKPAVLRQDMLAFRKFYESVRIAE